MFFCPDLWKKASLKKQEGGLISYQIDCLPNTLGEYNEVNILWLLLLTLLTCSSIQIEAIIVDIVYPKIISRREEWLNLDDF